MMVMRNMIINHSAWLIACLCCIMMTSLQSEATQQSTQKNQKTTAATMPSAQSNNSPSTQQDDSDAQEDDEKEEETIPRSIAAIIVAGNVLVPTEAILDRLPYTKGEIFDPTKTRRLIHNLYFELNRLHNIAVYAENIGADKVNLHIVVEEKTPLKEVIFKNNKQLTSKDIRDKINFAEIPAVDEQELKRYALAIQKLYKDKGFHKTDIATELIIDEHGKATAVFTITEYKKALVKQIKFTGNANVSSKELKNNLFTREDWLLSFMDKAGTYQVDRLEGDKHIIEQTYQNKGYINAKVVDVQTQINEHNQGVTLTYDILEGDRYTIASVKAPGNEILADDYLVSILPAKVGDFYSRENIVESIKTLEFIWGDLGYAYAHIEPSIQPDEETKTVSISFHSDIGKPVFLNKITIKGNKKTRDKIIRRKISLEEGGLLTTRQMEASKNRIEGLGYFGQRDGVNWKMTRLSEDTADLDLLVKEVKTGSAHVQLGFGGRAATLQSPSDGVSVEGTIADTNLFGSGVRMNLTGRIGADEKTLVFNLTQPWLFDRPIYGSMDIYHKRLTYEELMLTRPVNEKHTGGALTSGFVSGWRRPFLNETFIRLGISLDDIRYENQSTNNPLGVPRAYIHGLETPLLSLEAEHYYNIILAKEFDPGAYVSLMLHMGKDAKNHPMHPTQGYSWLARSQLSLAALESNLGFYKFDLDANWFTPIIGDYDLILRVHGYVGVVAPFKNRIAPYRELFHIGGPASVRGFIYGQIGPAFSVIRNGQQINDSIGGTKAMFISTELIFPVTNDFSIKGVVFYDGGAGWDNPYVGFVPGKFIRNNTFHYRHSVGVGIRLLNPMPIKVDWGFKLDPRKGELGSEVHFNMSYDW
jgi:outer membrane protein insertion porin family